MRNDASKIVLLFISEELYLEQPYQPDFNDQVQHLVVAPPTDTTFNDTDGGIYGLKDIHTDLFEFPEDLMELPKVVGPLLQRICGGLFILTNCL